MILKLPVAVPVTVYFTLRLEGVGAGVPDESSSLLQEIKAAKINNSVVALRKVFKFFITIFFNLEILFYLKLKKQFVLKILLSADDGLQTTKDLKNTMNSVRQFMVLTTMGVVEKQCLITNGWL